MADTVAAPQEPDAVGRSTASLISSFYLEIDYLLSRIESASNHYQTLGIERSATQEQVNHAYEQTVVVLQPPHQKVRDALSAEMNIRIAEGFAKVSEAFDTLANTGRRANYDGATVNKRSYVRLQPIETAWPTTEPPEVKEKPAPPQEVKPKAAEPAPPQEVKPKAAEPALPPELVPDANSDHSQTQNIRVFCEQGRAYAKVSKEAGASTRRCERFKLNIPALVTGHDHGGTKWKEVTKTIDVSRVGAAVRMSRRVKYGLIVHVTLPLPTRLRSHGFTEPSYSTYAIVRRIQPPNAGIRVVGLEFIGAAPPSDYLKKPWGTFKTQKWEGVDRRNEPRHKIVERFEIEYLDQDQHSLGVTVGITESLSASGCRLRITSAPSEFDYLRIKCVKRKFETLALPRNHYVGKDGVERLCVEFVENKCPALPLQKHSSEF